MIRSQVLACSLFVKVNRGSNLLDALKNKQDSKWNIAGFMPCNTLRPNPIWDLVILYFLLRKNKHFRKEELSTAIGKNETKISVLFKHFGA